MNEIVYVNGNFVDKDKALIPFNDRGFQFADGIYEVIKFYSGNVWQLDEHLKRMTDSLNGVRIPFGDMGKIEGICEELIKLNKLTEKHAGIYIQITRGAHDRMHPFPENISPTVCINSFEFITRENNMMNGIKVITRPDIRWYRCNIKSISLLPNILMMQEAVENGAKECIFIRNGVVTEATHSNVIGVKKGRIFTHPDSNLILPGITKIVIQRICRENKIPFIEEPISEREIYELDELMVVGTGNEITPVTEADGKKIGTGKPGPVTRSIQKQFYDLTYGNLAGDYWWKKNPEF